MQPSDPRPHCGRNTAESTCSLGGAANPVLFSDQCSPAPGTKPGCDANCGSRIVADHPPPICLPHLGARQECPPLLPLAEDSLPPACWQPVVACRAIGMMQTPNPLA